MSPNQFGDPAVQSGIGTQLHKFLPTTGEAFGVPCHEHLREAPAQLFQTPQARDGLTISWDDPERTRAAVSPTFRTLSGERLRNSRTRTSRGVLVLDAVRKCVFCFDAVAGCPSFAESAPLVYALGTKSGRSTRLVPICTQSHSPQSQVTARLSRSRATG